jgi:chromosome segregation ATPase
MKISNVVLAIVALAAASGLSAQQSRDDGGAARLQAMVQQVTAERNQLQTQNADLKKQLDAANAELKKVRDDKTGVERRLSQTEGSLSQATATNTRATASAEQQRARTDELVAQFRMTIETLRQTELERNELKSTLAAHDSTLKTCAANNQKLFDTGVEVLDRYEQKGCFSSLREGEPFTQNKRVQLQNLIDEYRWRLEDALLRAADKNGPPTAAASEAAGSKPVDDTTTTTGPRDGGP